MEQVKTATLDSSGNVPGFLDNPPHSFVIVEQNREITPDCSRILFRFHREHRAGIQFIHLANHGLDVVGTEENISQHKEKTRTHVGLELTHRRGNSKQLALLDVADVDAETAAITKFLCNFMAEVPDNNQDIGDADRI